MNFFHTYSVVIPLIAVCIAELTKVILESILRKKFTIKNFFHSGGMPSGHSALVGSIFMIVLIQEGPTSILFTITTIFSLIVIYDAINIRREAGKHAHILNILHQKSKLEERLGHTFTQAITGFLLGSGISYLFLIIL